ncbi:MAG: propionyl-CoA carboxylase, partial [Deltaproteobacteria bacterium]|nr:propionyl-CoA carboxylase [Deltaproteobacteria bacterium]
MAHVPVVPIGKPREAVVDQATYERELAGHDPLVSRLEERRAEVQAGWGDKYVDRVHEKDKLTTRERLERLKDQGSQMFEVGTFVNYGVDFDGLHSPAAGVVTAFVQVKTPEKIERAQEIARRLRLPALYLVDCSGLYLPEQRQSFAGATGAGHIFKMNSLLSAEGVPQIAGVFGDCIAGGGYMPIISDRVYMTEQAYMVIAGAALIKGAKSQHITSLDIGGPEVHVHQ